MKWIPVLGLPQTEETTFILALHDIPTSSASHTKAKEKDKHHVIPGLQRECSPVRGKLSRNIQRTYSLMVRLHRKGQGSAELGIMPWALSLPGWPPLPPAGPGTQTEVAPTVFRSTGSCAAPGSPAASFKTFCWMFNAVLNRSLTEFATAVSRTNKRKHWHSCKSQYTRPFHRQTSAVRSTASIEGTACSAGCFLVQLKPHSR